MRRAGGRAIVADGEAWGELWRDHQNRYFREHGIDLEVDPTAAHPGPHIGPVRMRVAGSDIVERAEQIRQANEAAARDPDQVLAALTRHNATFTARDLDRFLAKHLADETERAAAKKQVLEHRELVPLYDRDTGEAVGRFTIGPGARTGTGDARRCRGPGTDRAALRCPRTSPVWSGLGASCGPISSGVRARGRCRRLKLIEGRAGTGKSYALAVIRDAYEAAGRSGRRPGADQRRGTGPRTRRVSTRPAPCMPRCSR